MDTAGIKNPEDDFEFTIQEQIEQAADSADVILVVVEADVPITEEDRRVATQALKSRKPVFLVINKIDKVKNRPDFASFERVEAKAYTKVDLSGELALVTARSGADPLALTMRVENLFDTSYQQIYGFRSPGRALHLGVRIGLGL